MIRRLKDLVSKLIRRAPPKESPDNWYWVAAVHRLSWENSYQLGTKENPGVFDERYAERLSSQAGHFTREIGRLARSVVYANGLLLVLLSTKGPLPQVYGFDISAIFFAAEALVLWSSTAFAFLSINFVNQQAYEALLGSWCWNRHPQNGNDLLASYVPNQLIFRVLARKLSSPYGADRLRPGTSFAIINWVTWLGVLLLSLSVPAIQVCIIGASSYRIMEVQNLGWWGSTSVCVVALAATLFAIFVVLSTMVFRLPVQAIDMRLPIDQARPTISATGDYTKMTEQRFSDLRDQATPSAIEIAKRIESEFANVATDKKVSKLIAALALATLMLNFEQTYRLIFGSQIRGLRKLNEINETTLDNANEFFTADAVARFPDQYKNTPFDDWLSFLVDRGLVQRAPASVSITERGREFLRFLDDMKYRDDKNL